MTTVQSNPTQARRAGPTGPSSAATPNRLAPTSSSQDRRPRSDRRGKTTLSKTVVEKIAAQAASEVAMAGGTSGGFLGIGTHTDLSARPKVEVELYGTSATVALDLSIAYPTPIRPATDRVRHQLIERVHTLAGVEVTRVDITVTAFHADTEDETGELR